MADSSAALILSAILLSSGFTVFTKSFQKDKGGCNCTTLSSIIFLTAVFCWMSANNLNVLRCKLPDRAHFFYEFLLSLFVFEIAMRLFWDPLERFLSFTLPELCEEHLLDGNCVLFGIYCPGDTALFTALVYVVAISFLWGVLYGYGVIDESL